MKKSKKIIIILALILILICAILIICLNKNENNSNNSEIAQNAINDNETEKYDTNIINQLKNDINATADTNIYEVDEEYDGRKILQIKPSVEFDTTLAGVLKGNIPSEDEIQSILENRPTKTGIWISNQSRDKFLKILSENNLSDFEIDDDGYLKLNENATNSGNSNDYEILKKANSSDKQYIIDISGKSYTRDYTTGEIQEYPFELMDPNQVLESYDSENSKILEVTTNSAGILSNEKILDGILDALK